jgi:hypothetical protein
LARAELSSLGVGQATLDADQQAERDLIAQLQLACQQREEVWGGVSRFLAKFGPRFFHTAMPGDSANSKDSNSKVSTASEGGGRKNSCQILIGANKLINELN